MGEMEVISDGWSGVLVTARWMIGDNVFGWTAARHG